MKRKEKTDIKIKGAEKIKGENIKEENIQLERKTLKIEKKGKKFLNQKTERENSHD